MTNYQTTTTVAEDSDNSTKKQECWIGVDLGAANLRFAVAEPAKGAKDEAFVRVLPNTDGLSNYFGNKIINDFKKFLQKFFKKFLQKFNFPGKLFVPSILTVEKGGQERVVGSRALETLPTSIIFGSDLQK
jgi:molecular chaperone DnaK (HSP70)